MADANSDPDQESPPLSDNTTQFLLEGLRDGGTEQEDAWVQLLERCESNMRMLLRFRWAGPKLKAQDEDDLLQQLWQKAIQSLTNFEYRGRGSLQRWLATLLRYEVLSARHVSNKRPLHESDITPTPSGENNALFDALVRTQQGASQDLRRREREEAVAEVLASLPEISREAILLKIYEGLSGEEAAQRLGISGKGFSKRLHKALEMVRLRLRKDV